ncbi:MAG: hypothetical protein DI536_19295 [Archangium gephyra]|uniref:Uncharacterized protein n=1 Tax=Archangium gephyra TaxID=48 RepID=A0A2W5T5Q9_9BACT|nr:MAG: hypothetical protein DI536_19295 [Archangium gephyra]
MIATTREKYAARVAELEALQHELAAGKRPGDGAVVVGLLLEAAGDVLRRAGTLGVKTAAIVEPLQSIPELSLRSWADGVAVEDMAMKLKRAASQAVEAAIPDSPEAGEAMTRFAVQDLQSRDRLESALVALEALGAGGRSDAKTLAARLRGSVAGVDRECRGSVVSLTALNGPRRAEASLLDQAYRQQAWWYSERTGIEDDELVRVLGGETKGSVPSELKTANTTVTRKRSRPVNADDLLRYDLGLATPVEREVIRLQADADPELKLALAAMAAGEAAIEELSREEEGSAPRVVPFPATVERSAPEIIEERSEFKVLLFRSKKNVQVVVQPHRQDRFAAAAVYRRDAPDHAFPSSPGDMGLHFDLGSADRLVGTTARVVVKLTDGQTHAFEVRL